MVRLGIAASTGAVLVGMTATVKLCIALKGGTPLSETTIMTVFVPICAEFGVHVKTPLEGLMLALKGAPLLRANVSEVGGLSGSLAVLETLSVVPTMTVWFEIGESMGGWLVSTTIIMKACVALKGGVPLSVTITRSALVRSWLWSGVQEKARVAGSKA